MHLDDDNDRVRGRAADNSDSENNSNSSNADFVCSVRVRDEQNRLYFPNIQHDPLPVPVFNQTNHYVHEQKEHCQTYAVQGPQVIIKYIDTWSTFCSAKALSAAWWRKKNSTTCFPTS